MNISSTILEIENWELENGKNCLFFLTFKKVPQRHSGVGINCCNEFY